jgi:hypothetical protein
MTQQKVSSFTEALTTTSTDQLYLIQTTSGVNSSKRVKLSTLFAKILTPIKFNGSINIGDTFQTLVNTGTVLLDKNLTSVVATSNSSFIMPNATQGDTKTIVIESNPSYTITLTGTFATGVSVTLGTTGVVHKFLFHNGKWYVN